jgi:CheY-like chemotaxis protein/Tfp pilus assembly protein PilZ
MVDTISKTWEALVSSKKKRVLFVVDGDASYLYYTGMLLQRLDYNVYTTRTAEEVLDIMEFAPPLLVLTETSLPGMDGIQLLRKIKQNPKTKSVPVVVYTASVDQSLKHACQEEGCAAFLRKPFDPDDLFATVQRATEETPRRYIRLQTCLSVKFGEDVERARAMVDCITALSEEGVYISTSKPLAVGTQIQMTIFLGNENIRMQGTVLYCFGEGSGPLHTSGMGIKFTHIKSEDRGLIKAFIEKEITQDIARSVRKP